jgi:hypothetical protein
MKTKHIYIILALAAVAAGWWYYRRTRKEAGTEALKPGLIQKTGLIKDAVRQIQDAVGMDKIHGVLNVETDGKDTVATVVQVADRPDVAVDLFGIDRGELEVYKPLKDTTFTVRTTANEIDRITVVDADGRAVLVEPLTDTYKTSDGLTAVDFRLNTDNSIESIRITT